MLQEIHEFCHELPRVVLGLLHASLIFDQYIAVHPEDCVDEVTIC